MPIYEYKCEDCGDEFEEMLHFSEREDPLNKSCQNMIVIGGHPYVIGDHMPNPIRCDGKIHLKMSMVSFQLKGDGWYKDGYGAKKPESKPSPPKTADGVTRAKPLKDE